MVKKDKRRDIEFLRSQYLDLEERFEVADRNDLITDARDWLVVNQKQNWLREWIPKNDYNGRCFW